MAEYERESEPSEEGTSEVEEAMSEASGDTAKVPSEDDPTSEPTVADQSSVSEE